MLSHGKKTNVNMYQKKNNTKFEYKIIFGGFIYVSFLVMKILSTRCQCKIKIIRDKSKEKLSVLMIKDHEEIRGNWCSSNVAVLLLSPFTFDCPDSCR